MESTRLIKKRCYLSFNKVKSFLWPINGSHFCDNGNHALHSQSCCKHSMLFCLPFLFKTWLKFSLPCWYDKEGNISLASSCNHVRNIVFMTWSIKQCKSSMLEGKHHFRTFNGFTSFSFVRINISNEGKLPSFHMILLSFLFVSRQLLLIYFFQFFYNVASKSWLAWINMANEDKVDVFLMKVF